MTAAQTPAAAEQATVVLAVQGMRCRSCARSLAFTLERLDGVLGTDIDAAGGRAEVRYDPARVQVDGICELVEVCGFRAELESPAGR